MSERARTQRAAAAVAMALPGALAFLGGFIVIQALLMVRAARTGDRAVDRHRWRIVWALWRVFGLRASPSLARAVASIIRQESAGRRPPVVGDADLSGGPSIGPMQVYRRTAVAMGLWTPPPVGEVAAYTALASRETMLIEWGVRVLQEKLRITKGDLHEAIRAYNGSGPKAEAYRSKLLATADKTWGPGAIGRSVA